MIDCFSRRGRAGVAVWAWAPTLALALLAGVCRAEPAAGGGLELDLRDVPLVTAINLLIAQSQAEISFVDPDGKLQGKKVAFLSMRPKTCRGGASKDLPRHWLLLRERAGRGVCDLARADASRDAKPPDNSPASGSQPWDRLLPAAEEIQKIKLEFRIPATSNQCWSHSTLASQNRAITAAAAVWRELTSWTSSPARSTPPTVITYSAARLRAA